MYRKILRTMMGAGVLSLALLVPQSSPAQTSVSTPSSTSSPQVPQASPPPASNQKPSASSSSLPSAPSPAQSQQEPSLQDLGFREQQVQSNPALQARLNRRTKMLKIHQRLGLITLAPMVAALITGPTAKVKGRNGQILKVPSSTNLDFHAALGSATTALYFTTAYYAEFAPGIPGEKKRGAIRMHEALALVHGPGMILTPILGTMAFNQEQNGEKVHGIASAHGTVATVTALAYGASIVAVAWPIHLKFWEKR
ncbi:MAG: hypothetical protein ACRD25_13625 [Terracidiphilus sp.]